MPYETKQITRLFDFLKSNKQFDEQDKRTDEELKEIAALRREFHPSER